MPVDESTARFVSWRKVCAGFPGAGAAPRRDVGRSWSPCSPSAGSRGSAGGHRGVERSDPDHFGRRRRTRSAHRIGQPGHHADDGVRSSRGPMRASASPLSFALQTFGRPASHSMINGFNPSSGHGRAGTMAIGFAPVTTSRCPPQPSTRPRPSTSVSRKSSHLGSWREGKPHAGDVDIVRDRRRDRDA